MTIEEEKTIKPLLKLVEQFAIACAILSVLAENRIIAVDMFGYLPKDSIEKFEKDAITVLKYLEYIEK